MYVNTNEAVFPQNNYQVTMLMQMTDEEAQTLHRCLRDYHPLDSNEERLKEQIENELYTSLEVINDYKILRHE